ncbi:hypothetical protein ACLB1T_12735 [Escherichia coli]
MIRPETTVEALATLRTRRLRSSKRYGNGGHIFCTSDGAAAMLVMSESRAHELGLKPRARVTWMFGGRWL